MFSNLDHGISGGHSATHAFLSGVRTQEAGVMLGESRQCLQDLEVGLGLLAHTLAAQRARLELQPV